MIVVITTPRNRISVKSLVDGSFGFPHPRVVQQDYDALLLKRRVPKATYVFADLERLSSSQLRNASKVYRLLKGQGSAVSTIRREPCPGLNSFSR